MLCTVLQTELLNFVSNYCVNVIFRHVYKEKSETPAPQQNYLKIVSD